MIVDGSEIERTLRLCARAYKSARSDRAKTYACKVAIMELCGWVEVTLDELVTAYAIKHIKHAGDMRDFTKLVDHNSGFQYKPHLMSMFAFVDGRCGFRAMEAALDAAAHAGLQSALGTLKPVRNDAAHTHLAGAQTTYFAPSRTEQLYRQIIAGFKELEKAI